MTQSFGAVDLYAGSGSLSGTNLFSANKDPTQVLSTDTGTLLDNPETIVEGVTEIFDNMPEILEDIFEFLLVMPIELLLAFLGFSSNSGIGGLFNSLLNDICGAFTGTTQTGTTATTFSSGISSTMNSFCSLFTGTTQTGTTTSSIYSGLQSAIGTGSTLLTGNSSSITSGSGLISGFESLLNNLCGMFTGTTQTGTNATTITSGLQNVISTGSTAITGNSTSITTGAGLLSGAQGLANSLCSTWSGSEVTGTNGTTVTTGLNSTISTGSNVLTGNSSSITSGVGMISGAIQLMNDFCGLCTGDALGDSPAAQRVRARRMGLIGPTPVTNGVAAYAAAQSWIGTASYHLTGNSGSITNATALATAAQSKLDTVNSLVGGLGTGNALTSVIGQAGQYQTDTIGLLGNPTGLGTGSPTVPPISDIPLLGDQSDITSTPVIDGITGTSWFTDLTTLLGSPSGLGTGNVQIGSLNNIPILEPAAQAQASMISALYAGLTGNVSTTASPAQIGNALAQLSSQTTTAATQAQVGSTYVDLMAVTNPGYHAVDSSLTGVFSLTSLTGSSADTITVTETVSAIGFILIPSPCNKESMVFYGAASATGVNAVYLNLYTIDTTTSKIVPLYSSTNIVGSVGTVFDWVYLDIPSQSFTQGQWMAAELAMSGPGSITMVGLPDHWMGANTNVFPQQLGATRNTITPMQDAASSYATNSSSATGGSWSHTLASDAGSIYVILNVSTPAAPGTVAVSVGGAAATLLESYQYDTQYATPLYDATGAGYTSTTATSTVSGSWSHTATAGAAVIVGVATYVTGDHHSSYTCTATYGGTSMTSLGAYDTDNSTQGWVQLFGILDVAGGAKTVAISISGGDTVDVVSANSVSYTGVGSFGAAVTNDGSGASPTSGAITSSTGQRVVQAFGSTNSSAITASAYSGAQRVNQSVTGTKATNLTMGDAPGQTSVTITETITSSFYASVAVPMQGNIVTQTGGIYAFDVQEPPTGEQTISFALQIGGQVAGAAVSYLGDVTVGSPVTASGSGTALSQTVTGNANEIVLQTFAQDTGEGTISSYNQTSLESVAGSSTVEPILTGQAVATGSSQTFSATSTVNLPWGAMAIPIASNYLGSLTLTPTYSQNIPWLALSSESVTSEGTFAPAITSFDVAGMYTFDIPFWANYIDIVCIGGGANGTTGLFGGSVGDAGAWNGVIIQRSIDFLNTAQPTLTVVVGAADANSSVTWTNLSDDPQTLTADGGGGPSGTAGPYVFDGATYVGGAAGASPGGGGTAGGLLFGAGGAGAAGAVWIVCRVSATGFSTANLSAAISGVGALTATAGIHISARSHGALTGAHYQRFTETWSPTGHGALTGTAGRRGKLSGTGALTAAAYAKFACTPTLSGHGVLAASVKPSVPAVLTGHGTLAPTAFGGAGIVVSVTGFGHLVGGPYALFSETAALAGQGVLSATAAGHKSGLPQLAGTGVLSGTAYAGRFLPNVAAAGHGVLSGATYARFTETAALSGHGALVAYATPAYDATGSGYSASSPTTTMSWTHDVSIGNVVYVWISTASSATPQTVTYGGQAMNEIATVANNNSAAMGALYLYSLPAPPTGAQTVEVDFNTACVCAGNSVSYASVTSATPTTSYSNQANPSQQVTITSDQMVIAAFSSASTAFTGYSGGTGRFLSNTENSDGSLIVLDSTASTTFKATMAAAASAAITVVLT